MSQGHLENFVYILLEMQLQWSGHHKFKHLLAFGIFQYQSVHPGGPLYQLLSFDQLLQGQRPVECLHKPNQWNNVKLQLSIKTCIQNWEWIWIWLWKLARRISYEVNTVNNNNDTNNVTYTQWQYTFLSIISSTISVISIYTK